MQYPISRRTALHTLSAGAAVSLTGIPSRVLLSQQKIQRTGGPNIKISLNAYSFNQMLRDGAVTLIDLLEFCAQLGIDAIDPTGYYFPGYPAVPPDDYIYRFKLRAFQLGIVISGTGVRNDFSVPDAAARQTDIALVKAWIDCAVKLSAPYVRVFAGRKIPDGYTWEQTAAWVIGDLKTCAAYGAQRGIMVALQNHNDFIKTASQIEYILKGVGSDWFGLMLDIGSLQTGDPYEEIARVAPYAVTWQIKELVYRQGMAEKTDLRTMAGILKSIGYRGYLPIETLGPGDPYEKVTRYHHEVREALEW